MRWQRVLWCAGAVGLALGIGCEVPAPVTDPPADVVPPKPRPHRQAEDTGYLRGVVAVVGPDWFELAARWEGGGTRRVNLGDTTKSRRVSAAGTMLGGDPAGDRNGVDRHWVSDLKVGDVVAVGVHIGRDGSEWPVELFITRRPGGKIPPMHETNPGPSTGHLGFQALQDWEEKGIPIPSEYRGPDGRVPWTNPPYPPVAPAPREAKR
jgi:hypothetical protein